jgi:hypothetical protein
MRVLRVGSRRLPLSSAEYQAMTVLIVTYDLRKPGRNYDDLYAAIRKYKHCHALDSSWFIDTSDEPSVVRDKLCAAVDGGDQIYVMRLRKHWAACRNEACTEWLKDTTRTWD